MTNMQVLLQREPSRGRTFHRSHLPPSPPLSADDKLLSGQLTPHFSEDHTGSLQSFTADDPTEEDHLNYPLFTPIFPMASGSTSSQTSSELQSPIDDKFGIQHVEDVRVERLVAKKTKPYLPFNGIHSKKAAFEKLPTEIYDQIIPLLYGENDTNTGFRRRNADLVACLRVSKTIHHATLATLYKRVNFSVSRVFAKFLEHIEKYPYLGTLVRRIDFSHFTSMGQGRTGVDNRTIQYLTDDTLTRCLKLTPNLQEFLGCEALGQDLTAPVLYTLFEEMPYLAAVDFCGVSSPEFNQACNELVAGTAFFPDKLPLKRLGFHDCTMTSPNVFASLLPLCHALTHLDLTHTPILDETLLQIPENARITHLSLSKCYRLTGDAVVDFLITHPAVKSLKVLLLHFDTTRCQLLSHTNVDELLPSLPESLVSLNLTGASISSSHMSELIRLVGQLEELSLGGADLTMDDLNALVAPEAKSRLKYLDLSDVGVIIPRNLLYTVFCSLLTPASKPLEVIEFNIKMMDALKERDVTCQRIGWTPKSQGRRGWLVRHGPDSGANEKEPTRSRSRPRAYSTFLGARRLSCDHDLLDGKAGVGTENGVDDGSREWKMGGKWWGARKINLAWGEIGGSYGYYGFGK